VKKRIVPLAGLAALLLATAACGGSAKPAPAGASASAAAALTKVTLTLNWIPYGEHAPFYYGLKKGFYSAEGIDLTIKPGTGSGTTIQQVDQKNTTFGWADTPVLMNSVAKGLKVKSLGSFLQKGPSSIEYLADHGINSPADLKGKKIGGTVGDALYATFPAWLKANGLAPSDVTVVNLDAAGKIAALAEGRVDAIMGFFHDQGPTIENKTGKTVKYFLYADYGMNMLGTGIVANTDAVAANPDLAKRFVRATQKSWAEAAKDIPGAVDAMVGMAQNEPPKNVLTKQLTLCLPLVGTGTPGVDNESDWTNTVNLLSKYGTLKNPGTPDTYWDSTYAK
jgi:ABC-type nitrate/sulfonate/bicarbonate transport system substrate-binding protein